MSSRTRLIAHCYSHVLAKYPPFRPRFLGGGYLVRPSLKNSGIFTEGLDSRLRLVPYSRYCYCLSGTFYRSILGIRSLVNSAGVVQCRHELSMLSYAEICCRSRPRSRGRVPAGLPLRSSLTQRRIFIGYSTLRPTMDASGRPVVQRLLAL